MLKNYLHSHPAIALILLFNLFHLVLIPWMGLMPQAAYYHFYGENWSLSYFDHPPIIGYLSRIFTMLFGKNELTIHGFTFLMSVLTQWAFFRLACRFLNNKQAKWALAFLSSSPLMLILVFNSTPDVPLMLFWTLSLLTIHRAISNENKYNWLLTGLLIGLAFDSKYAGILILPALFAFLVVCRQYRKWLFTPWPYLMVGIFIVIISPVIVWNVQNDFASFSFQSSERVSKMGGFKPDLFAGFLGTQLLLALPVIFVYIVKISLRELWAWVHSNLSPAGFYLMIFSFPFFAGFGILSFIYWIKINWTFPAFVTGIIMATPAMGRKVKIFHFALAGLIHLLLAIQLIFYVTPIKSDDTWFGWETLAHEVKQLEAQYPDAFVFAADDYKTTAQLIFYNSGKYYGRNIIGKPALHFDYLGDDIESLIGRNAIFLNSNPKMKKPEDPVFLKDYFSDYKSLNPIEVYKKDRLIRKFEVYYAINYLGLIKDK